MNSKTRHPGGCHCGAVRYEVNLDPARGSMCNCTLCQKLGTVGAMVSPADFRLLAGEEHLSGYAWGEKTRASFFCKRCGVHCFARGHLRQLGGDYVSVNLNALDDLELSRVQLLHWDGRHDNWQAGTRPERWPIA